MASVCTLPAVLGERALRALEAVRDVHAEAHFEIEGAH